VLTGKDVPSNFLNCRGANVVKTLVGGDRLSAEIKGGNRRFDIVGQFNCIITSNCRLHVQLDGDTGAWRRRLLLIDYELPPPDKPIPEFDRLLIHAEGPGILNWCVAGAAGLLAELRDTGRIAMTDEQHNRVDSLLMASDSVAAFVRDSVHPQAGADVTVDELTTAYNVFCERRGWQAKTIRQFQNELPNTIMDAYRRPKRTDVRRDGKNARGFTGIGVAP
jgi:putative DNA primase/helicase